MTSDSKLVVTPEAAQRLGEPIEKARLETERRRVDELEYSLTKTRDALRVIARALEDMAERHACASGRELSGDDVSLVYGAVNLLDCVAADCDRAYKGEAMA